MKRLLDLTPVVTDQRDAFDALEGLPARADNIGEALLPYVPDTYFEGAIGWTGHCFNVNEIFDEETWEPTGEAVIYVPDELAAEHPDGTVVELPDGRLVTIDLSQAVDVQSEQAEFPMQAFIDHDGENVFIRPSRVAAVLDAAGGFGTEILFPSAEDPVLVALPFDDAVNVLQPQLLSGLIVLHGDGERIAVNPRYVLAVRGDDDGAVVILSGGRIYQVTETRDAVVAAMGP